MTTSRRAKRSRISRVLGTAGIFLASSSLCLLAVLVVLEADVLELLPRTPEGYVDVRALARRAAAARGHSYDERSAVEVVLASRSGGSPVYPTIGPAYYIEHPATLPDGSPVLPLGMPAHARTYYCNERGDYVVFESDRFGFRNPDTVWDTVPVDLLVVGDSFAMGSCLPEPDSIVGRLRSALPATVSLGMGGNGPLLDLAGLREFLPVARPRVVVWMFFENDLEDLERERSSPLLMRYLEDPAFRQGLASKADAVSRAAATMADQYLERAMAATPPRSDPPPWWHLPRTRSLLAAMRLWLVGAPSPPLDPSLLLDAIAAGRTESEANGAAFLFVYLPDRSPTSYRQDEWKARLLEGLSERGIETLDLTTDLRRESPDGSHPAYFFLGSHLSEDGAALAARLIRARLAGQAFQLAGASGPSAGRGLPQQVAPGVLRERRWHEPPRVR